MNNGVIGGLLDLGSGTFNGGSKVAAGPANVLNLALDAPGFGGKGVKLEGGGGHHAVMHANYFMTKMDPLPLDLVGMLGSIYSNDEGNSALS
jgi:hypothetical protein